MITILGLLYTIGVSIGALIHKSNENFDNDQARKRAQAKGEITYLDRRGNNRFVSNNELAFYTTKKGDWVVEDIHGRVHKNFTQERRDAECVKKKHEALANNETTYCIAEYNNYRLDGKLHMECYGSRFKDFETDEVYVIRFLNHKYYYMRISDAMIVRETDWQIKQDKYKKENNIKIYDFEGINIEEFNEKQKTVKDNYGKYLNHKYNGICDWYK